MEERQAIVNYLDEGHDFRRACGRKVWMEMEEFQVRRTC